MLKGIGGLFLIIVVIVAIANGGDDKKSSGSDSSAQAEAAPAGGATGDNIDGRSRYFVNQIRRCMKDVNLLGQVMQGGLSDVQLAEAVRGTRNVCDAARERMALADTSHFSDQALDAEVALNEFRDGLKDVQDYIDTLAPSKAANGKDHFATGRAWMEQALDAINARRAIYGAPALG
jgi:hypothetical protein